MIQPIEPSHVTQTLKFPTAGIDVSRAFCRQMPRQLTTATATPQGQPIVGGYTLNGQPDAQLWGSSTPSGINVRGFEPLENRSRGGSRPGLSKYIPVQASGSWVLQSLGLIIKT